MSNRDDLPIGPGTRVTLHFAVLLASGEEVDRTRDGKPAVFEVGDGNLLPGFEEALFGLEAGDRARLELPPSQAFGEHRRENVQRLDRARFRDVELEPGVVVSFAASNGELPGVIRAVHDDTVEVDFNHPLAGQHIVFDVSILRVEPAESAPDDTSSGR